MMVMENEDLGLNLSLGFVQNHHPRQMNLRPSFSLVGRQKLPWWNQSFVSSTDHRNPQFIRGIDVNSAPSTADCGEDPGASSPNSTMSSILSGKRSEREGNAAVDDHETTAERAYSRGTSDEEDGGDTSRKKLRLSKDQSAVLEETFKEHNTLNPKLKLALAKRLGLTPRQVEVWFQNRRARTKLKQTEVDCEYLRRCVETLTEENRRLQNEVAELRALKLSPKFCVGSVTPPTTLIMCPSCERVAGPPSATSSLSLIHQLETSQVYQHHQNYYHHRNIAVNKWLPSSGPALEVLRPRS